MLKRYISITVAASMLSLTLPVYAQKYEEEVNISEPTPETFIEESFIPESDSEEFIKKPDISEIEESVKEIDSTNPTQTPTPAPLIEEVDEFDISMYTEPSEINMETIADENNACETDEHNNADIPSQREETLTIDEHLSTEDENTVLYVKSERTDIDPQRTISIVDDMSDMPRTRNYDLMTAMASTSFTQKDIYQINEMEASMYNKKVDGELSISPVNGNVSYSCNLVYVPGKNGLNLSLGLQHNSYDSMPIVTCGDLDPSMPYDTYIKPDYHDSYNDKLGSGWKFTGLKRSDKNNHYFTARDGRCFNRYTNPFKDVKYENGCLVYMDGTIETISSDGYLTSVEDKYGNKITYTYDSDNNLTTVSDTNGNTISITYTDNYVDITKPDNNKIRLNLTDINIKGIGQAYGFNEDMNVKEIKTIQDCSSNTRLALFEYTADEFMYISYRDNSLVVEDYGVFVAISENFSPNTGEQKIDYTPLTIGKRFQYSTANRMSRFMAAEKYYTSGNSTPSKTYTYEVKDAYLDESTVSGSLPTYIKTSELTADGKLTVTENNKGMLSANSSQGISQKVYDTNGNTDRLISESETTYYKQNFYYPDFLRPESVIQKVYSEDNNSCITIESAYDYDFNSNLRNAVTKVDGIIKSEENREYHNNAYKSLKKSEILDNGIVDTSTVYEVNNMGDVTNERIYSGTDSDTLMKEIQYTYNNDNNIIKTEILNGSDVLSSEEYEYSADGVNITSLCTKDDTGSVLSQELYTYDKMGNMLSVQNVNGTERFEYDSLGRVKKEIHPDGTAKTIFYEWVDRSFSIKNELSAKVGYFYNAAGLLSSIEEWFPDLSVYNMYYDTMGNLNHVVDRRGNHTYITNDILGRQTKVSYPRLNSSVENSTEVKYHDVFWDNDIKCSIRIIISPSGKISCEYYDVYGRKYKTALIKNYEDFTASDFDNITSVPADAELMVTGTYVYDNFDRLIEEYDGENRKTAYTYDVLGNVLSETTGTGAEALTVSYEYDSAGRCVKMIRGGNHITTYEYDRAGRLIKTTDPMKFTETYTYDTAGNVLTSKDKNGTITTNTYDNRGRLSKIQKGTQSIEYTYDAAGNLLTSKDSSGTITYEYNADSTLKKKTYPDGKSITYSKYDKDKRLLEFVDYFGNTTAYTYDAHGNIASIGEKYSGSSSYKNTTYTYNQDDTLSKVNIPNNMTVQYTYDYAGRVTKLKNYTPYVNSYSDHLYEYDNSNNIVKSTENMFGYDTLTTMYTYDSVNRLKYEDKAQNQQTIMTRLYCYDQYNNLSSISGNEMYDGGPIYYNYDANNRLIQEESWWIEDKTQEGMRPNDWIVDYTYDNNGNLIFSSRNSAPSGEDYIGSQKTYSYNVWGQLTGFSDSLGESTEYTYYSDGLRSSRKVGSTTYKYYYNGDKVVNETKNGSNFATNVYGVDGPISRQYSGYEHYFYKNIHGDVIYAFTSNHWCSSEYSYGAYGDKDTSYDYFSANPNPLRYSGEYLDTESGMTYLRARYYDPYQRRFISEDPAKDGLNWYAYCGNNPVMYVDPSGMRLILTGSNNDREALLGYLKSLTNDNLTCEEIEFGWWDVTVEGKNDNGDLPVGTSLVRRLIENGDYTCYVKLSDDPSSARPFDFDAASNQGSGSTVNLCTNDTTVQVKGFWGIKKEVIPKNIELGHELIHALRYMGGNRRTGYGYLDGYINDAECEEYETTGISYYRIDGNNTFVNAGDWYTTENALRREHGHKIRVRY
ncbi:MAG: RHS repeat-associated core domain-containing protein [bacterium]|nr:RHS repeat-associated core domain-containing protein [bacterium]